MPKSLLFCFFPLFSLSSPSSSSFSFAFSFSSKKNSASFSPFRFLRKEKIVTEKQGDHLLFRRFRKQGKKKRKNQIERKRKMSIPLLRRDLSDLLLFLIAFMPFSEKRREAGHRKMRQIPIRLAKFLVQKRERQRCSFFLHCILRFFFRKNIRRKGRVRLLEEYVYPFLAFFKVK